MNVTDWLLDSDPAIRWQVMRDLTDAPDEDVAAERTRVARKRSRGAHDVRSCRTHHRWRSTVRGGLLRRLAHAGVPYAVRF